MFPLPVLGDRVTFAMVGTLLRGKVIKVPDSVSPQFTVRWDNGREESLGSDWFRYGNVRIQTRGN